MSATTARAQGGDRPITAHTRSIGHLDIVYDDLPIFKVWHLEHRPAVVIGMDVLGTVDALILDYRRAHVYIMPYHPPGVEVTQTDSLGSLIGGGGP